MKTKGALAVIGAVVLGLAAFAAHHAGSLGHVVEESAPVVEDSLLAAKNVHDVRGVLDDLSQGRYVDHQAVDLFCAASASLNTNGELPDEATDWREFVKGRVGITTDSGDYFEGKLSQLDTTIDLEERSPPAAYRYAKACLLR